MSGILAHFQSQLLSGLLSCVVAHPIVRASALKVGLSAFIENRVSTVMLSEDISEIFSPFLVALEILELEFAAYDLDVHGPGGNHELVDFEFELP